MTRRPARHDRAPSRVSRHERSEGGAPPMGGRAGSDGGRGVSTVKRGRPYPVACWRGTGTRRLTGGASTSGFALLVAMGTERGCGRGVHCPEWDWAIGR